MKQVRLDGRKINRRLGKTLAFATQILKSSIFSGHGEPLR